MHALAPARSFSLTLTLTYSLDPIKIYCDDHRPESREKIRAAFLQIALYKMKAVACPKPGCTNSLLPITQSRPEKCSCSCGMIYCSQCQEPYHYDCACTEAVTQSNTWDHWLRIGHGEYLRHKARTDAKYAEALAAFDAKKEEYGKELKASMERRRALERVRSSYHHVATPNVPA